MIKTFMTGFVVDEPRTFTTKDGTDMYSFKIQVQNMDGNPDRFEVVAKKDDEVFPLVRKDAHVSVAGDLVKHAYEKEGKKYTIYQVKFPTITF